VAMVGVAGAQEVPVEQNTLAGQQITLHVYPFLQKDDLKTLRAVAKNEPLLQMFVTAPGFAAIAVAPNEGFLKDGVPAPSAIAMSGLPDAAAAGEAALKGCEDKRKGGDACVVVFEAGPAN